MKKSIVYLMMLVMLIGFTGCSGNAKQSRPGISKEVEKRERMPMVVASVVLYAGMPFLLYYTIHRKREKHKYRLKRGRYKQLSDDIINNGISPSDFFEYSKALSGDAVGVYILYNVSKNKYYVGQAKRLCFRITQHFTGHGNGDVYCDYKKGDQFKIKIIKLRESEYDDLDELERVMIEKYDAYRHGYNKTRGNG